MTLKLTATRATCALSSHSPRMSRPPAARPQALRRAVALAAALTCGLSGWAPAAQAQTPATAAAAKRFDIPGQPLAAALAAFAEQSGLKLAYPAELLAGKTAPAVQGTLSPDEALARLLAGSGLRSRAAGGGALAIEAVPATAEGATTLRPVRVGGASVADPAAAYVEPVARAATKTDTPLMETPMSVQVVTRQVMQDQLAGGLDDVLANVSGAFSDAGKRGGSAENIWLRGFETSDYFRDGVLFTDTSGSGGLATLANVERVEVLKGPAAVLYGRMEPGGMVNLVTKKPQATPYHAAQQTLGSSALRVTEVDITGPIDADKAWRYRVVAAKDAGGNVRKDVSKDKAFLAPSLSWVPRADTQVNVAVEYTHDKLSFTNTNSIFDPVAKQILFLPRENNIAPFNGETDTLHGVLSADIALGAGWKVEPRLARTRVTIEGSGLQFGGFSFDTANNNWTVSRSFLEMPATQSTTSGELNLTGKLRGAAVEQTVLLGADYRRVKADIRQNLNFGLDLTTDAFAPVNPTGLTAADGEWFFQTSSDDVYGLYLQDQLKLPGDLHLVAGLRKQWARLRSASELGAAFGGGGLVYDEDRKDDATTPRLGALWQLRPELSVYSSYTQGFGLNNGWDFEHKPLPPQKARQAEVGVKGEWRGGKLTGTLSWYTLTKVNMATGDPLHPGFSITIGEVRSRGIEGDLQGEIQPGWQVMTSFTRSNTVVTKSTEGSFFVQGKQMPNVPRHMEKLATTYALASVPGWKIGAALRHMGATYSNDNVDVTPAYTLFDAMASVDFRLLGLKATGQLNVKNLTDKRYYSNAFVAASASTVVLDEGKPRSVAATLKLEF